MPAETTTQWPLLDERTPFAQQTGRLAARRPPRSTWLLVALAFLCGGLVSAAGFAIGWRHQAQRGSEAEAALAAATAANHALTARNHALAQALAAARDARGRALRERARAAAETRALLGAAAAVSRDASASTGAAAAVADRARAVTNGAARLAGELKTLAAYLTGTPSGQLDPGYVASQTAYLSRQLVALEQTGGSVRDEVAALQAAAARLARAAAALTAGAGSR
ncbi:MAG TPA: hypothetical protein VE995_01095 [Gaiellaceae bacterium]|nr:hypothetical protein [Gaiellaceae bacterium]